MCPQCNNLVVYPVYSTSLDIKWDLLSSPGAAASCQQDAAVHLPESLAPGLGKRDKLCSSWHLPCLEHLWSLHPSLSFNPSLPLSFSPRRSLCSSFCLSVLCQLYFVGHRISKPRKSSKTKGGKFLSRLHSLVRLRMSNTRKITTCPSTSVVLCV